jgi:hypothetical protein
MSLHKTLLSQYCHKDRFSLSLQIQMLEHCLNFSVRNCRNMVVVIHMHTLAATKLMLKLYVLMIVVFVATCTDGCGFYSYMY